MREEANEAKEAWSRRLADEARLREGAETQLRELQMSAREERNAWEARAAADAADRRRALEEERANVSALEEKLAVLAATRAKNSDSGGGDEGALHARLEEKERALARAEARMARMAKDLAEAEEELEERDRAADRERAAAGDGRPPLALPARSSAEPGATAATSPDFRCRRRRCAHRPPSGAGGGSDDGRAHPVFSRVRNNRHGDVEDMLSSGAVDPDIRDDRGNTVLAVATQNNRKRIVKAAVRAGVLLDAQNAQGQTAMHFAYAYGYDELAEYLIRKGANPMVTNVHGLRPDEGLSPDRLVGGNANH